MPLTINLNLVTSGDYTISADALHAAPHWVREVVVRGVLSDARAMTEGKTLVVQRVTDSMDNDTALVALTVDGTATTWKLRRTRGFIGEYSYFIEDETGTNQCIHGAVS